MSDLGPVTWRANTVHCPPLNPLDSGGCREGVYMVLGPWCSATIQPILFTDKLLAVLNWNSWHLRPATASPDSDNHRKLPDTDNVCSHLTDHWKYL